MSEFEYLRNVTIGQYLPTGSAIHRLDPRAKLTMVALFLAGAVISNSLVGLAVALAAVLGGLALARIRLRYALQGVRPVLPFLILLALLQIFAIPQNDVGVVLWKWWLLKVTVGGLVAAALILLRFVVLILGLSLFSFSTNTTELTHGTEQMLRPLQRLGLPAHEFALAMTIAIRFVPLLALEAERIAKAQASRGADFGRGPGSFIQRTLRMLPLLVPLFITALRRADTLVMAMEARCYTGGRGRTHLIHLHARRADALALLVVLLLVTVLLAAAWFKVDARILSWIA